YYLHEIKPDKQPIGVHSHAKPFTTHDIQLREGDGIYVFSDGFQDQFGGPKGKKFKAKSIKTILLSHQNKSMREQYQILLRTFEEWKGEGEQTDDVTVIGVRV
ncbi:MAG: serine/threonine protein phosphatase, partial [Bacteroidetes bacterium]